MSDEQTSTTEATQDAAEKPQEGAEVKTFDAEYVDKLRKEAAKYRTEAKAKADAAAKLAQIEEASKTAEQKAAERLAEMEAQTKALEAKATRAEIASESGIPADILAGPEDSSTESIKAYADLLAAYLEKAGKPRPPRPDANQGRSGTGTATTADQFAAAIEGSFTR